MILSEVITSHAYLETKDKFRTIISPGLSTLPSKYDLVILKKCIHKFY